MTDLDFAEVEKAKFRAGKEVLVTSFSWVDRDLVPGSASSPGDDKDFIFFLKPLVRMAMPAEKQPSLVELKKGSSKVNPGLVLTGTILVTL